MTPTTIETLGPLLERHYRVVYASDKKNKLWRLLDILWVFGQQYRRVDFVVIDTYGSINFYVAWVVARLARLGGKRYIPILHGGNLPIRLKNNPGLCRHIFQYAYCNVAPSGYMQAAFVQYGYETQVIPNSIHLKDYRYHQRSQLRPRLLWVRSFATLYNPALAIETLKKLLSKYPNARLCMVGPDKDGSLAQCKALAQQLGVSDRIVFTGKLPKAAWHTLAGKYNIFLNTTNIDNTPISVMEAMALGLPVVSTNVGGIPYLLEDQKDALLVPPADVDAMVEAIETLLDNSDLSACLAQNARQKVEAFDSEKVINQWRELIG